MCGITGIVNYKGKEDQLALLEPMLRAMQHRGPDATGVYMCDEACLGHSRLSIIDLSGGYQPIHNEANSVWIVFNGEIFNYPELRDDLIAKGHQFYTQSDTEVIVHLYEEHGWDLFEHLNGQFAIAIWDNVKKELVLGRDRMGIRPLFYYQEGKRLHFASEIKALLTDQRLPRQLSRQTLADVFTCWTPMDPLTAFEGIFQLPPGHRAVFSKNGLRIERYWQLDFGQEVQDERSAESWAEELQALLLDAARIRLRADVPVGAYLSGGIDSTYISTLVKNHFNNKLHTFSVQFSDKRFDESKFQQRAISAIQTDHRAVRCTDTEIGEMFPKVVWHTEVPMIRTAPAPLMILSGLVRRSDYKVVLTGEGADEIFAGYNIFKEAKVRRFWARQPDSACRPHLLKKLYPYIFENQTGRPNAFLFGFFKRGLDQVASPVYSHLVRWQNTHQLKGFFRKGYLPEGADLGNFIDRIADKLPDDFDAWSALAKAQYLESTLFLSNYLLSSQGDRMAMANSVEGRFPFLDHRVVEFAARIPAKMRLNGLTEKFILKQVARGQVPEELVDRAKQPYRAPISRCFMGEDAPDYVEALLSEEALNRSGVFDPVKVKRLVAKCQQQDGRLVSERENMALVAMLSTQLLDQQFIQEFPDLNTGPMEHTVCVQQ